VTALTEINPDSSDANNNPVILRVEVFIKCDFKRLMI